MKYVLRKLNQSGVGHHVLLAVLVVSTFAGMSAYRVFTSTASTTNNEVLLDAQGRKPNGCVPGKLKSSEDKCVKYNKIENIKQDCEKYHLQYDSSNNACKDSCMSGWYKKDGNCVKRLTPEEIKARCLEKHQQYDSAKNDCKDACVSGWYKKDGKLPCVPLQAGPQIKSDTDPDRVKAICDREHLQYDEQQNVCKTSCKSGWYKKDGKLPCIQLQSTNPTTEGPDPNTDPDECPDETVRVGEDCVVTEEPGTSPDPVDPDTEDGGNFEIIVYTDKNFKGKSTTFTSAQDKLPKEWNDKISSFKIKAGRWQLCEDANYQKNCTKRWASAPELTNKSKPGNDKISSLQPVVTTKFENADEDVIPVCVDANGNVVPANDDNLCPEGSKFDCLGDLELKDGACKEVVVTPHTIVPVDTSFKEGEKGRELCELLGREWIGKVDGKTVNGGQYGCSEKTCRLAQDGAPRQFADGPVCISNKYDMAYAEKMDKMQCDDLHRVWIEQVKRCAQVPNRNSKATAIIQAKQCYSTHSTYFIFKDGKSEDECFKPGFFDKVKGVVKATGGVIGKALQMGPQAYCNTFKKANFHWNGQECVPDRKNENNANNNAPSGTIRVGVYNAASVTTAANQHVSRISKGMDAISKQNAEIVAIQELSMSQTDWLRNNKKWDVYRSNMGGDRGLGIAYLKDKFTVIKKDSLTIPRDGQDQVEPIITLERKSDKARITVMSVHLVAMTYGKANYEEYQKKQQNVVKEKAVNLANQGHAVVVAGDFNWFFDNRQGYMSPLEHRGIRVMRIFGMPGQKFSDFKAYKNTSISDHHLISINVKTK